MMVIMVVVVVAAAVALVGFTYSGLITNLKYAIFARHILARFSVLNFCRQVDTTSLLCVQFMHYMQCTHVKLLGVFLCIVKLCEKWVGKGLLIR